MVHGGGFFFPSVKDGLMIDFTSCREFKFRCKIRACVWPSEQLAGELGDQGVLGHRGVFFFDFGPCMRPCVADERGLMSGTVSFNVHSQSPKAIDFLARQTSLPKRSNTVIWDHQIDSTSIYHEL